MNRRLQFKNYGSVFFITFGVLIFIFSSIPALIELYHSGLVNLNTLINSSPGFSVGLALIAVGISLSSGVKMDINSNENFLRIVDRFEDKRIDMFQHNAKSPPDFSKIFKTCWKSVTYMKRAVKLYGLANIDPENQSLLFQQVEQLIYFSDLPWGAKVKVKTKDKKGNVKISLIPIIADKTLEHLIRVCELCFELGLNVDQIAKLSELFGHMESFR